MRSPSPCAIRTATSSTRPSASIRVPRHALVEVAVRPRPGRPVRDAGRRHALAHPQRERPGRGGGRRARQGLGRAHARAHRSSPAIGIFFLLPLFIATVTTANIENGFVQHLVEGLVRVAIFLGYLRADRSRRPDIARVFQYHGAEHMTIHALEAGDPLTVDEVRKYPTAHQRCGTEFLVVVILLSIIAFSLVGRQTPLIDGR